MVYCGKPSRGCQMCRTRRIKCDETKPTCLQCEKSRRQCPGYKDDFDLVFRNETQATERRARRSLKSKRIKFQTGSMAAQGAHGHRHGASTSGHHHSSSSSRHLSTSSSSSGSGAGGSLTSPSFPSKLSSSRGTRCIPGSLGVPVEQQALHYFLANYVFVPQSTSSSSSSLSSSSLPSSALQSSRGFLGYLLPLLQKEPAGGGTQLSTAFAAVTLAALGNRPNSKRLLGQAAGLYSQALMFVNRALTQPRMQKADQTLASVLLLGLFETITLRRAELGSWGTHIEGAIMLVRMRGRRQLRTAVERSLFASVRSQMLVNCMSASKFPEPGVDWWCRVPTHDPIADNATRLNLLVCALRADVNRAMTLLPRSAVNWSRVLELQRRAQDLEQGFLDWEASLPPDWRPRTVAWADGISDADLGVSEVYPGRVDLYADLFMASQWNMARVARLLVSGILIRCAAWFAAPVDYRTTPEYAQASRVGMEMVNDVVASIPFHLGWRGFRAASVESSLAGSSPGLSSPGEGNHQGEGGGRNEGDGFACGNEEGGKSLGAYFVLWPLFTATVSDFATDAQRKYIVGRMRYMTDIMGLNGAAVLTQFQLRLPSMIIKRDLMCMFASAAKMPGSNITAASAAASAAVTNHSVPPTITTTSYPQSSISSHAPMSAHPLSATSATSSHSSHAPSSSSFFPPSSSSRSPTLSTSPISPATLGRESSYDTLVVRRDSSTEGTRRAQKRLKQEEGADGVDEGGDEDKKMAEEGMLGHGDEEDDGDEEMLDVQAATAVDWARKEAEKEAFRRTYGTAIRETSGDDVGYLHPEAGVGAGGETMKVEGVGV